MKKAVIYGRVSTERQEEQKTIDSQLAELREICKKDGVEVVKEYIDDGWSGGTLDRPALDQLRDDAPKGLFKAIYFHSQDRLARDHIDQGIVERELMKRGIEVIYYNKPVNDENRLETGMKALFAEHERRLILERTRRGRLHKAKQGIIVSSNAPYGYDKKGNRYEINKNEAGVVKLIFNLYIQFNSQREIIRELSKRNIRPREGKNYWGRSSIGKVLTNETYIGTTYFNKRQRIELENPKNKYRRVVKNGLRLRDRSEWIPIKVSSILDEDIFQTVQGLLKRNTKINRVKSSPYLLSGLIKCGYCGSSYCGEKYHGEPYYRCNNRHKTFPNPPTCKAGSVKAEKIENYIWNKISGTMKNPKLLTEIILGLANKITDSEKLLKEEKTDLLKEKGKLAYKKDKALELYTDENIDKEALYKKMNDYSRLEEGINQKIKDIEERLGQLTQRPSLVRKVEQFSKLVKKGVEKMTFQERQEFLKFVIEEITYYSHENKFYITGHIPVLKLTSEKAQKLNWKEILLPQTSGAMALIP